MTYSPEGPNTGGAGSPGYGTGGYGNYGSPRGSTPQPSPQSPPQPGQPQPGQSQPGQPQPGQSQFSQAPYSQQYSQPGQSSAFNPVANSDTPSPLPRILALVVAALGVVNFISGLAGQYSAFDISSSFFLPQSGDPTSVALLLASGIVAALGLLPKQSNVLGVSAALAATGWLVLVFQAFSIDNNGGLGTSIGLGGGAITVLVLGFIQSAAAVVALLFGSGVLKVPAPKPVSYGQQNPFQGYGQSPQPGYGQQAPNPQAQHYGYGQPQQGYGAPGQSSYAPPAYTGQTPNQNTTGSLGYPVGTSTPETSQPSSSGLTGPAGQNSPYSQYQYGQPPVGSAGYGQSQHSAPSEPQADSEDNSEQTPPHSAPTQAFGTTPDKDDQK